MQTDGKSGPKSGVSAYRIFQQKVAATALAASNGIQYPNYSQPSRLSPSIVVSYPVRPGHRR